MAHTSLVRALLLRFIAAAALAAVLLAAIALVAPEASHAVSLRTAVSIPSDVVGDDERDRYVGTGSVFLPGDVPDDSRQIASDCPGCDWKATIVCEMVSASSCRGDARLCQGESEYLRFWVKRPGEDWRMMGMGCVGPGGPPTRTAVDTQATERFIAALPPLAPRAQPPLGAVVTLPVGLRSGQRPPVDRAWEVAEMRVVLHVSPLWEWRFGDGTGLRTTQPGDRWPRLTVSHAYARPGSYRVRVVTTWTATYTVDGLGPFPVAQAVHQGKGLRLRVGEARAVLVR